MSERGGKGSSDTPCTAEPGPRPESDSTATLAPRHRRVKPNAAELLYEVSVPGVSHPHHLTAAL